jgi:hypothetical protein
MQNTILRTPRRRNNKMLIKWKRGRGIQTFHFFDFYRGRSRVANEAHHRWYLVPIHGKCITAKEVNIARVPSPAIIEASCKKKTITKARYQLFLSSSLVSCFDGSVRIRTIRVGTC